MYKLWFIYYHIFLKKYDIKTVADIAQRWCSWFVIIRLSVQVWLSAVCIYHIFTKNNMYLCIIFYKTMTYTVSHSLFTCLIYSLFLLYWLWLLLIKWIVDSVECSINRLLLALPLWALHIQPPNLKKLFHLNNLTIFRNK